ncbi:MAG TPA: tetratricopeptide repeat protein [Tepidisphaeraceae bacterium]|jgi:tetratricopeptide (TPR) repeat protein|nr:tetratricopeptide repeat protein [Tepidisphaeraceae bacterium]
MRWAAVIVALLFAAAVVRADVVNLVDGSKIEGKIQRTSGGWTVTQDDGTVVTVSADKVASIEASRGSDASAAKDRLESLRRVADHLSDMRDIISRYQSFIAQTADPAAVADANKDLQTWQQRLDQGLVRLGDQWVTTDERDRRRELAQTEVLPVKDLISNYRYKDAAAALQLALKDDPQCAAALYLQGVLLYRQDQVAQARNSFEAVNPIVPNHAPTLNNLAVIAWRQKSFVVAMNFYDQAMMSSPQSKEILDNVAEALNALPDANKQAPVVLHAVQLFAEQDTALQQAAAQRGMYRWGATWVTAGQLKDLKAAEARVKQKLDDLQAQFDALQQKVNQIDQEIGENQREMDRVQASNTTVDLNGNVTTFLPDVYFQLQRDNKKLAGDKQALQQQQNALKNRANEVRQELPIPKFTGLQQIIGVDGAPLRDLPTSGPTTMGSQAN